MRTTYVCKSCGKSFFDKPSTRRKFCSRECYIKTGLKGRSCLYKGKHAPWRNFFTCIVCGVKFPEKPCKKRKYCSKICEAIGRKGKPGGTKGMHWKLKESTKKKIAIAKINSRNPNWKGESVGYAALHDWVKRRLEKPKRCEWCRRIIKLELANISNKYLRRLDDWVWICRRCHMKSDGRWQVFMNTCRGNQSRLKDQAKVKYIKSEPNEEGKWKKACHGLYRREWTTKRRRAQKSAIPASNQ